MTAAPALSPEARPVEGSERVVLLDALRGFALCGVFISNVFVWFSGRVLMPRAQVEALAANASLADTVARYGVNILVIGKFIALFSFLFGLGFAVQMERAEQRGTSIVPLYARRLGVLLVIGLAHMFLIWFGDILSSYALLGFGLLLFRARSDKTLLLWASVFIFLAPIATHYVQQHPELFGGAARTPEVAKAAMERTAANNARLLASYGHDSYPQVVLTAASCYVQEYLQLHLIYLLPLLGRFLLGLLAGRRRIFHEASQHRPLFRKLFVAGLLIGAPCASFGLVMHMLAVRKVLAPERLSWVPYVFPVIHPLGELGLAAFYLASFALLFQRSFWKRVLSVFAPAGRMALTNYLSQSVISVLLFYGYGLGLIGKLGPALCVALSVGIFALQVLLSHLWLSRFRFGPIEWVWRSLTYGKAQPMRLVPANTVTAA